MAAIKLFVANLTTHRRDCELVERKPSRGHRSYGWFGRRDRDMLSHWWHLRRDGLKNPAMNEKLSITPAFSGPDGLVTVVAQNIATGDVLMVAHMNREAWDETVASGRAVYYSRSRQRLWRKGEESGNVQLVREIFVDCDADAVLLKVEQVGGAGLPRRLSVLFLPPSDARRSKDRRRACI